jgi:hypothetical protein
MAKPSAFFLCCVVPKLDYRGNSAFGVQNHRLGKFGDFPGPQSGFER